MANAKGKTIDNSHLPIDTAEERIMLHRDYLAHCMRWSHVARYMQKNYATSTVLDLGCGIDLPLAKMLYSNRFIPDEYIGVDYNPSHKFDTRMFSTGTFPLNAFGSVDFANDDHVWFTKAKDGTDILNIKGDGGSISHGGVLQAPNFTDIFFIPNVFTCFEVIEHIEPAHVCRFLLKVHKTMKMSRAAKNDPIFFLSTPNWDVVHTADNHVNEMKHEALGWVLEELGFKVFERFGTFASIRDYTHLLFTKYPGSQAIYERLWQYYDSNVLAIIFAPLFPAEARNCIWTLKLREPDDVRLFPALPKEPWTSSEKWKDLVGAHHE